MLEYAYCPKCGKKYLVLVGISGRGGIYKCYPCKMEFIISRNEEEEQR